MAFRALDASVAAGWRDLESLEGDSDLAGLHEDTRWTAMIERAKERAAAWERSLGAPELRRRLLAMVQEDQAARFAVIDANKRGDPLVTEALITEVLAVDERNTAAMKEAVARYGWPGKSLVGEDGAHAAWLLVQHADRDRAFQKDVLGRTKPMVDSGEVSAVDYAYLYDRVAVAEHHKQLYGTQFDGEDPAPIEDEEHLEERRRAVGLPSMAEHRKMVQDMYGPQ